MAAVLRHEVEVWGGGTGKTFFYQLITLGNFLDEKVIIGLFLLDYISHYFVGNFLIMTTANSNRYCIDTIRMKPNKLTNLSVVRGGVNSKFQIDIVLTFSSIF